MQNILRDTCEYHIEISYDNVYSAIHKAVGSLVTSHSQNAARNVPFLTSGTFFQWNCGMME